MEEYKKEVRREGDHVLQVTTEQRNSSDEVLRKKDMIVRGKVSKGSPVAERHYGGQDVCTEDD